MLYETQWESLRHKWIETSFVVSRFPDPVDQTTQETEFTTTNYWESFQNRIMNLSYVDGNVHLWKPDSIQHISGTARTKGDIQGSFSHNTRVTLFSYVDVVLDLTDTSSNYRETRQRQVENISYVDANAPLWKPESVRLFDESAEIKENIHGSSQQITVKIPLSGANVVLPLEDTGTSYWDNFKKQVENLGHVVPDPSFPDHRTFQHINDILDTKEYLHGSYLHSPIIVPQSDADEVFTHIESGTAITKFTHLLKHQIEKQTSEISEQFDILSQREDNWDERGSLKPTNLTLAHAKEVMEAYLKSVTSSGYQFNTPTISSDGDGNVTAVWYKEERQLHFQIGEHEKEYFKVWGINIDTEMDVDYLKPENYLTLWKWLIDE